MTSSPPSGKDALDLHERLLDGDPVAPSDFAVAYLDYLADWLIRQNPRLEESFCVQAAEDAILELIRNPAAYSAERGPLEVYLRISASGDLKNLLRSERRHSSRRVDYEAVELSPDAGKYLGEADSDPAAVVERWESILERMGRAPTVPSSVRDGLTPQEVEVLELMQIRERKTERYAAALGLSDLPFAEQRSAVKRVKDRLTKKIQRAGERRG